VRRDGILTLEEMVRKMTSLPARTLGLRDRGLLLEGMYADIAVFNMDTVEVKSTFEAPHQYSEGVEYVIVNGEVVVEKGKHTGKLPGRFLRHSPG
jgi:N-acyl-D-aspartate/D-glutamate deacylase